jgi:putative PIN family toxin of toxin-antitoxin system
LRVVLDTNVLVAGLLNPNRPPGRILDYTLGGDLMALVDDRILAEYRLVLPRRKFDFDAADVTDVIFFMEHESERVVARRLSMVLPDPRDLPFIEVALSGSADALITGNIRHFRAVAELGVSIEMPARFLERL